MLAQRLGNFQAHIDCSAVIASLDPPIIRTAYPAEISEIRLAASITLADFSKVIAKCDPARLDLVQFSTHGFNIP